MYLSLTYLNYLLILSILGIFFPFLLQNMFYMGNGPLIFCLLYFKELLELSKPMLPPIQYFILSLLWNEIKIKLFKN